MSHRVEQNMHWVKYVIKKFFDGGRTIATMNGVEVEDLEQVGMIGLIKADRDFSYDKNVSFFTYAVHKIRGEIRRFLRDTNPSVKFPRTIKDVARSLDSYESITVESIIEKTGINRIDALGVLDYINRKPYYIHQTMKVSTEDGEWTLEDVLPAQVDVADEAVRKVELQERLGLLNPKTRQICLMMLDGHDQKAVSKKVGISQSRVSRHISNAMKTIEKEYSTQ